MPEKTVIGKRVLLAEDEMQVREAIRLLLSVDKHQVTEARDGREALALFQPGQYDLVITDYKMPRMQGDELAMEIKRQAPRQPVLMISAYTREAQISNSLVDAVLNKPFSFADLRKVITRLLCDPAPCAPM